MGLIRDGARRGNALGTLIAQMLNAMNTGQQAAVDPILAADSPGAFASTYYATNGTTPAMYIANQPGNFTLVLIDGARTYAVASAMYNGYAINAGEGTQLQNGWAGTIAAVIRGILQSKGWWGAGGRNVYGGFSAGGMVATVLARLNRDDGLLPFPIIHTFGSPRVTGSYLAETHDIIPCVRWMWNADPVPLLPLRFTDAPWILPIVGLQGALNAGRFTHWSGGWQLVAGQIGHPEEIPTVAEVSPVTNLATWFFNMEGTSGTGHSIGEYAVAMASERALYRTPNTEPLHVEPAEPIETQTRRLLNQHEREIANSIATREATQNATPVSIPTLEVFRAVRIGRVWTVTFGGVSVALSRSKKAARGLAREMNLAFRRLQRTAVVDPNALQTQLTAYLQAASDPAGAFRPVLNTTF